MYAARVILALVPVALPAVAVCPGGWIGVGTSQLCMIENDYATSCGGAFGTLFENDCNIIDENWDGTGNWCTNSYDSSQVYCVGGAQTQPYWIYTTGGNFGNCQRATGGDVDGCSGPQEYNEIWWCCSPS